MAICCIMKILRRIISEKRAKILRPLIPAILLFIPGILSTSVASASVASPSRANFLKAPQVCAIQGIEKSMQGVFPKGVPTRLPDFLTKSMGVSPKQSKRLARHLLILSRRYGFSPNLILGVIYVESSFRLRGKSWAGALGLMQLLPSTARSMVKRLGLKKKWTKMGHRMLFHPQHNITLGVHYLSILRDRYFKDPRHYITAYNTGPTMLRSLLKRKKMNHFCYYHKVLEAKNYFQKTLQIKTKGLFAWGNGRWENP